MCGIIGYIGAGGTAFETVLTGLGHLEHRGYDSAGASFVFDNHKVETYKVSKEEVPNFSIRDLSTKIDGAKRNCYLGIGHTRWASCGVVNETNAHPHYDHSKRFFVVHNGNVVNFDELRKEFPADWFYSKTDTEIIPNLIAREVEAGNDLQKAVEKTMLLIEGPTAILVVDSENPEILVAANRGGTLLYVRSGKGDFFIASDPAPLVALGLPNFTPLKDGEMIISGREKDSFSHFSSFVEENSSLPEIVIQEFDHLMKREIFEQPAAFNRAFGGRLLSEEGFIRFGGLREHNRELQLAKCFHFLGCGTAFHACEYAVLILNRFGIRAEAHVSSEFCYSHKVFDCSDVFFIVSQSGETADSVKALHEIKIKGNPVFGIINQPGSLLWRETGAGIHIAAGAEKSVASTKAFTCQLLSIAMLAVYLARQRNMASDAGRRIITELKRLPILAQEILNASEEIGALAQNYIFAKNFYFLGRYFNSVVASEGALKLKEVSYVHAEGYPLGEMKHGPLALIDDGFVCLVIAPKDDTYQESLGNIREIRARNGQVIVVTDDPEFNRELCDHLIVVPSTLNYLSPILTIIPLQIFAYHFSIALGFNPDKPRNLAKTVTVG